MSLEKNYLQEKNLSLSSSYRLFRKALRQRGKGKDMIEVRLYDVILFTFPPPQLVCLIFTAYSAA
jgi:hypothetical protein